MNAEEDTIRILSRPTFNDMLHLRSEWMNNSDDRRQWKEVLFHHGWDYNEFYDRFDIQ